MSTSNNLNNVTPNPLQGAKKFWNDETLRVPGRSTVQTSLFLLGQWTVTYPWVGLLVVKLKSHSCRSNDIPNFLRWFGLMDLFRQTKIINRTCPHLSCVFLERDVYFLFWGPFMYVIWRVNLVLPNKLQRVSTYYFWLLLSNNYLRVLGTTPSTIILSPSIPRYLRFIERVPVRNLVRVESLLSAVYSRTMWNTILVI